MSSTKDRVAAFRRLKKLEGFTESTVWLSQEDRQVIEDQARQTGLSKSDIIRIAVRRAFVENGITDR